MSYGKDNIYYPSHSFTDLICSFLLNGSTSKSLINDETIKNILYVVGGYLHYTIYSIQKYFNAFYGQIIK